MKILLIDDQQLVTLPLQKRFLEMGYEVKNLVSSLAAIEVYETFLPDLVIIDMNMPIITGTDIISYIRLQKGDQTPVIVLSGTTDDDLILKASELGIQAYIKKPLNLSEVCNKVEELIGTGKKVSADSFSTFTRIPKKCTGIVVPCYNQVGFLQSKMFTDFINNHSGYHFCFINDASTDDTLQVLNELKTGKENYVTVYHFETRRGISQTIRFGMLSLAELEDLDYVGFIDPDLINDFSELENLENHINSAGSKMVGNVFIPHQYPTVFNSVLNFGIKRVLSLNYTPGQSMVQVMKREIVPYVFREMFTTERLYGLEMRIRLKKLFGRYNGHIIAETTGGSAPILKAYSKNILKQFLQIMRFYRNYEIHNSYIHTPQHS